MQLQTDLFRDDTPHKDTQTIKLIIHLLPKTKKRKLQQVSPYSKS